LASGKRKKGSVASFERGGEKGQTVPKKGTRGFHVKEEKKKKEGTATEGG